MYECAFAHAYPMAFEHYLMVGQPPESSLLATEFRHANVGLLVIFHLPMDPFLIRKT